MPYVVGDRATSVLLFVFIACVWTTGCATTADNADLSSDSSESAVVTSTLPSGPVTVDESAIGAVSPEASGCDEAGRVCVSLESVIGLDSYTAGGVRMGSALEGGHLSTAGCVASVEGDAFHVDVSWSDVDGNDERVELSGVTGGDTWVRVGSEWATVGTDPSADESVLDEVAAAHRALEDGAVWCWAGLQNAVLYETFDTLTFVERKLVESEWFARYEPSREFIAAVANLGGGAAVGTDDFLVGINGDVIVSELGYLHSYVVGLGYELADGALFEEQVAWYLEDVDTTTVIIPPDQPES